MVNIRLNDRYEIQEELGRGGMGVVYRGRDTLLERDVAVKLVSAGALGSEGQARLLQEARAAARLNHPNIVAIFDLADGVTHALYHHGVRGRPAAEPVACAW